LDDLERKMKEIYQMLVTNEKQISKVTKGEPQFEKIEIKPEQFTVKTRPIYLNRAIIEASDHARVTVLQRERELIKAELERTHSKTVQDLEANVLAYQDLLMTKEL